MQNLYNDYKSRTGARKLIDKMMKAGLIEKVGERNNTLYKTKKIEKLVITFNIRVTTIYTSRQTLEL